MILADSQFTVVPYLTALPTRQGGDGAEPDPERERYLEEMAELRQRVARLENDVRLLKTRHQSGVKQNGEQRRDD